MWCRLRNVGRALRGVFARLGLLGLIGGEMQSKENFKNWRKLNYLTERVRGFTGEIKERNLEVEISEIPFNSRENRPHVLLCEQGNKNPHIHLFNFHCF